MQIFATKSNKFLKIHFRFCTQNTHKTKIIFKKPLSELQKNTNLKFYRLTIKFAPCPSKST